jgi:hypothetical protein
MEGRTSLPKSDTTSWHWKVDITGDLGKSERIGGLSFVFTKKNKRYAL